LAVLKKRGAARAANVTMTMPKNYKRQPRHVADSLAQYGDRTPDHGTGRRVPRIDRTSLRARHGGDGGANSCEEGPLVGRM